MVFSLSSFGRTPPSLVPRMGIVVPSLRVSTASARCHPTAAPTRSLCHPTTPARTRQAAVVRAPWGPCTPDRCSQTHSSLKSRVYVAAALSLMGIQTRHEQAHAYENELMLHRLSPREVHCLTSCGVRGGHLSVLLRYSAIFFFRSAYSSHGIRQILCSAAKCSSAFARLCTMRYASPTYSWAPRWRGLSCSAR
jgi:hypothetical protein